MLKLRHSVQLRAGVFAICKKYFATRHQLERKYIPKVSPQHDDVYVEQAEYPEIKDLSFKARKEREVDEWRQQLHNVPTVEEKIIKINMPRYYGYKAVLLKDDQFPYNCLPAIQHYTRTIYEDIEIPKSSVQQQTNKQLDAFILSAKAEIQDSIEFIIDTFRYKYPNESELDPRLRERFVTQQIVEQINRTITNVLIADCQHLQDVEVDYNPRHEAFWFVGGIEPPKNVVKSKEGREWQKDMAKDPVDRIMQYIGSPYLTVRHRHQLPEWKEETEYSNLELAKEIPRYNYDPRTLGYSTEHRHGTNIPGYWPGSPSGFGCISYQPRDYLLTRPASYGENDFKEVLHAQAIQCSYAWLLAQANYNGFNTFTELTYPMNTQTIITNGRDWSFYEYQLNTLLVHTRHVDENARVNFCRGTSTMQLYEEIDSNGKCVGFNEEVLRHLIQFYANAPTIQRTATELQPYLHPEFKRAADYPNEEQRNFIENTFKHIMSNRPRHLALPEIYLWEKIYKIDNKTRPMEAKRRYFELDINPWKRTLDQRALEYIPRAVRPEGPKSKKKYKKTYYP